MGREIRVVIITPNDLNRTGLISLLQRHELSLQIIGAFREITDLEIIEPPTDILLLDEVVVSGRHMFSKITEIHGRFPHTGIMILSERLNTHYIQKLYKSGVLGFIYKQDRLESSLPAGIEAVNQGYFYSSPRASSVLITNPSEPTTFNLNQTDMDVLTLIDKGHSMKEITVVLQLSLGSVYRIRNKLRAVLGAPTNQHLIGAAYDQGLLPPNLAINGRECKES